MLRLVRRSLTTRFLETLSPDELHRLHGDWPVFANLAQRPPLDQWRTWLLLGGRGGGKTWAGAHWLKSLIARDPHIAGDAAGRVALVGETFADARAVMVEGESGLLAVHGRAERPQWNPSKRELLWRDGTIGQVFSASDPEGLRGSQFGAAWCDEVGKWEHPDETWDMLQFCLRLGRDPRRVATTTPRPLALLRRLIADPATQVTRAKSSDNRGHLAPGFLDYLNDRYGGTRLGRQELDGEIVEDREDALWRRSMIEAARLEPAGRVAPEDLERIVVAVDPPAGSGPHAAACGIVAAGRDRQGRCLVLADRSVQPATPLKWSMAAIALYRALEADCIVAEVNQGGDMVKSMIHNVDPSVPVRAVRASRGKWLRAEPVALLYERGLVRHAGRFAELEDEMCAVTRDGKAEGHSPDRVDALVWAVSELMLIGRPEPRIRMI